MSSHVVLFGPVSFVGRMRTFGFNSPFQVEVKLDIVIQYLMMTQQIMNNLIYEEMLLRQGRVIPPEIFVKWHTTIYYLYHGRKRPLTG